MTPPEPRRDLSAAAAAGVASAERLDALAETAELMGDDAGASQFRERATYVRLQVMDLLDERSHDERR